MTHRGSRHHGYADGLPSYQAKLPAGLVVVLRDSDGSVLDSGEVAEKGFELTQEILSVVWGQMRVHEGSYITIEREE